jgi:hypothetical protein
MTMRRLLLAVAAAIATPLALMASPAGAGRPLQTAFVEYESFLQPGAPVVVDRMRNAGATAVRMQLNWADVAPKSPPAGFDATDPEDPAYDWSDFDERIGRAVDSGLRPIVYLFAAPRWAEGRGAGPPGTVRPDPVALGRFARAAARRYSGDFDGVPRVSWWQVWNEPNILLYLNPQLEARRPVAPGWYREMVNRVAAAVKSVDPANVVVAGGLAPFRDLGIKHRDWGPLTFMRELLCLGRKLQPVCRHKLHFDVWSHHPYTSGGPMHHAVLPDDVSIADLPEMRKVLQAAIKSGIVVGKKPVPFWVTEFGWDSSPPDPKGIPASLHARWVAEGLYRMWTHGVSLVAWLQIRDDPMATSYVQSGLYRRASALQNDRPKPALQAFRFPFVAFPVDGRVSVWGRTPGSRRGRVLVEQTFRGGWRQLGTLRTDAHGIFQSKLRGSTQGLVRASLIGSGDKARPFSLKHVPDRFYNVNGQPTLLEPKKPRRK